MASRAARPTNIKELWRAKLRTPRTVTLKSPQFVNILYVTATLPYDSGEAFLIPEVKELVRRGCDVRIVPRSPKYRLVHDDAAELMDRSIARPLLGWDVLLAAAKELVVRPRGALHALVTLLSHGDWKTRLKNLAVYPKGLWLAAMARNWQADHIHVHWLSTPATIGLVASIASGTPWSCTAHRADINLNNLLQVKLRHADIVRFISKSGLRMAESLGVKVDRWNSAVIHVGVSIPPLPEIPSRPNRAVTILCPANLYPVKGHKYLLGAMALLRAQAIDCKLLLAGDGGLRSALEAQSKSLGLTEMVQFLGQRSHSEILAMYRNGLVDLVVLPSVDLGDNLHEGIPVALMEAMSYAIPVVATRTGGIPELLDGSTGLLVPDKSPPELADAIKRLIIAPDLRKTIGLQGRQRVCESFSVEAVVSQLLDRIAHAPESVGETTARECATISDGKKGTGNA